MRHMSYFTHPEVRIRLQCEGMSETRYASHELLYIDLQLQVVQFGWHSSLISRSSISQTKSK